MAAPKGAAIFFDVSQKGVPIEKNVQHSMFNVQCFFVILHQQS